MARKRSLGKGSRLVAGAGRIPSTRRTTAPSDEALRAAPDETDTTSRLGRLKTLQRQQSASLTRVGRSLGTSARTARGRSRSR